MQSLFTNNRAETINSSWIALRTDHGAAAAAAEAASPSKLIVNLDLHRRPDAAVSRRQRLTHPALTPWQRSSQNDLPPRNCVQVRTQRLRCGSDVLRSTALQVTCVRVCRDCPLRTSKEAFQKTAAWTNRAHQESSLTKK